MILIVDFTIVDFIVHVIFCPAANRCIKEAVHLWDNGTLMAPYRVIFQSGWNPVSEQWPCQWHFIVRCQAWVQQNSQRVNCCFTAAAAAPSANLSAQHTPSKTSPNRPPPSVWWNMFHNGTNIPDGQVTAHLLACWDSELEYAFFGMTQKPQPKQYNWSSNPSCASLRSVLHSAEVALHYCTCVKKPARWCTHMLHNCRARPMCASSPHQGNAAKMHASQIL